MSGEPPSVQTSSGGSAQHGPLKIINAGLMRTGTLSMARAYEILGYRAHHALEMPNGGYATWAQLERAAEATWPGRATLTASAAASSSSDGGGSNHKPMSRADWDAIFGQFDAVTDAGAFFAEQLVQAYPQAKVVIVQRDFDRWYPSFESGVASEFLLPVPQVVQTAIYAVNGFRTPFAMRKIFAGFFGAWNMDDLRRNAKGAYEGYYQKIRELVPEDRRLEYKLGDGWEPLCAFLGREIPDVPFPRVNDRDEHAKRKIGELNRMIVECWVIMRPWMLGGMVAAGVAFWLRRSRL